MGWITTENGDHVFIGKDGKSYYGHDAFKASQKESSSAPRNLSGRSAGTQKPTQITPKTKQDAKEFARSWAFGDKGTNQGENFSKLVEQVKNDPGLAKELGNHRPAQPIKVYRSAVPGENHELQSWTTNREDAQTITDANPNRVTVEHTANPSEVLFSYNHFSGLNKNDASEQNEVVLMRGETLRTVAVRRGESVGQPPPVPEKPSAEIQAVNHFRSLDLTGKTPDQVSDPTVREHVKTLAAAAERIAAGQDLNAKQAGLFRKLGSKGQNLFMNAVNPSRHPLIS